MEDAEEFCIEDEPDEEEKKTRPLIKNAMDLQRLKLEKLMKNPDKPIIIPEPSREKDFLQTVPTFVRNVMGSSAGAGSGEFHVYRHLRRKEYARQKYIQAKSIREQLDDDYRHKLEQNRLDAEAKTAKRRAKRLKKKQKMKQRGKKRRKDDEEGQQKDESVSDSSESEDEVEDQGKDTGFDAVTETDSNKRQDESISAKETEELNDTYKNDDNNTLKDGDDEKPLPDKTTEEENDIGDASQSKEAQISAEKEETHKNEDVSP